MSNDYQSEFVIEFNRNWNRFFFTNFIFVKSIFSLMYQWYNRQWQCLKKMLPAWILPVIIKFPQYLFGILCMHSISHIENCKICTLCVQHCTTMYVLIYLYIIIYNVNILCIDIFLYLSRLYFFIWQNALLYTSFSLLSHS